MKPTKVPVNDKKQLPAKQIIHQKPQLQSVSNFFNSVRPCFLLHLLCFIYLFALFWAVSFLNSFTQFDGNSDSLKFCKRFRDTPPLTA